MRKNIACGILAALVFLPCTLSLGARDAGHIRVVMDDNYPPYIFRDKSGALRGILVDQWALWEKKTGVRVELDAMDWAKAKTRMEAGAYDVIDTIFINEQRKTVYDFSRPYAQLDAPLFFSKELSGIRSAADLHGFIVGVKKDDNAGEILKSLGISDLLYFDNYEQIITAARDGEIKVFTVDEPPALYFLIKMGIQDKFRQSEKPLYTGEFHRAVRKGNTALLDQVERGFSMITGREYDQIKQRWFGRPIVTKENIFIILWVFVVLGGLFGVLLLWVWTLRRTVARRTRELQQDIIERKKAEEVLLASQVQFRKIIDASPMGMHLYELFSDGRLVFVGANPAADKVLGVDHAVFAGKNIEEAFPGLRKTDIPARYRDVALNGVQWRTEQVDYREGVISGAFEVVAFQIEQGKMVAMFNDITERKRAQENICRSEGLYRGLVTLSVDGILIGSHEGIITEANECMCQLVGMPKEELIGKAIYSLPFTPESVAKDPFRFDLLKQGQVVVRECSIIRPDGVEIVLEMRSKMMPDGTYQSTYRDITERKRSEDLLAYERDFNRALVQNSPVFMVAIDPEGKLRLMNDVMLGALGYSMEEIKGVDYLQKFVPLDEQEIVSRVFERIIVSDESTVNENHVLACDNQKILVEWHGKKVMKVGGDLDFIIGLGQDITERRKAENELEEYRRHLEKLVAQRTAEVGDVNRQLSLDKKELERINRNLKLTQAQLIQTEKMASLGRLVAGVAHEINNPISYISTNLSVLEKYTQIVEELLQLYAQLERALPGLSDVDPAGGDPKGALALIEAYKQEVNLQEILADFKKLISETNSGVARVTGIVFDLRTFAREEKETKEFADINISMDRALSIAWSKFKYNVEVVKEYSELPQILCYPRQMEQIFINLLMNAAQSITEKGRIIVKSYPKDRDVFVEVQDNGCGIPETDLPRIFDPFFTTKEVGQGTGLGLSIVYNLVKNHQGEITVNSVIGEGTTFIVRLPV